MTHANQFLAQSFKEILEERGHIFFDNDLAYNLNIIGVRNQERVTNRFEDTLYIVYRDGTKQWKIFAAPVTTIAGDDYFQSPARYNGCAVLSRGQYRGAYKIGKHRGAYSALVQRNRKVKVYRDNNKDLIVDEKDFEWGFFGINIHKAGISSGEINRWSAGCQVFQHAKDFYKFMSLCKKGAEIFGNSFTYTLL